MRSIRRLECLLLLAAFLAACPALPEAPLYQGAGQREPVRGGVLMAWEEARVSKLDPHMANDVISGVVISMLFDSLYTYDHELNLVPMLAAALPQISDDGRTLVVPLRRGVRFHNGRELTASDVVWSFERMLHPATHSPGATYYRAIDGLAAYQRNQAPHVRGLSAPDASTFRIELERADQSFVHTLAMRFAAPLPREEVARAGGDMRRKPVGTGPFRLTTWDPGIRIVVERNRAYYQPGKPYLDGVVFEEGVNRNTALMRFRNAEVDIVPRMSAADSALLTSAPWRPYSAIGPQPDVWAIFINVELAPFDNVHLRRAVAFAIDRARWSKARNYAIRPSGQILPPKIMGHDPALPHLQTFDLRRARAEMKLAGFANGLPEPVTLWGSASATGRQYGELFQADMAKIGIEVVLKPVSFPVYLEETAKRRTAQLVAGGWSMDFPDPSNLFHLVSSASLTDRDSMNRAFFSDPTLDALLERAIVERDTTARTAMYHQANDMVSDLAPWAIYANTQALQAWQPYVKGFRPHPIHWLQVNDVWLDLPRKRVAALLRNRQLAGALASLFPPSWSAP
jgi:ABC-type transport system substrate-binding protein